MTSTRTDRVRQASRERREQQKESLRQTILAAAGELFLEHGYEDFSMRQVAERIGYSATTIYRYFENKDDLLFAILYAGFVEFRDSLLAAAEGISDPMERLEALGRAYIKFGTENRVHYQLMFMQRSDFLFKSRANQTQPMAESFDVLQHTVEEAMAAGMIPQGNPEAYAYSIWATVHGLTALAITGARNFTETLLKESTDIALRLIRQGLTP
jgi:AcrR family transcriptional regulator